MHEIILEVSFWKTKDDFYSALLQALGAPAWHGCNLDALNDSLSGGDINSINPPLCIVFKHVASATPEIQNTIQRFTELTADLTSKGIQVEVVQA